MNFDAIVKEKPVQEQENFNMQETKALVLAKVQSNSQEIMALTDKIDLGNMNTIVTFGKDAAEEIAKCSDTVLRSVELDKLSKVGSLTTTLTKIMDQFDSKEVKQLIEDKGFLAKLFGNAQRQLEQFLNKYTTMGDEVDKVVVGLRTYEDEIRKSNDSLEVMFNNNLDYYQLLEKYILAGEEGLRQIEDYRVKMQAQYDAAPDDNLRFQLQSLEQGKLMLEQRVQDLRMAENVAMQSIPMIKAMQFSNANLARKINSAFIITLPIFKQSLAQAVLLKKQKLQADALSALDQRTNEMLIKNAQNTVEQTKMIAQMASGSTVKIETLQQTYQTIVNGIEETRRIQEEASQKRLADKQALEQMKADFERKVLTSGK